MKTVFLEYCGEGRLGCYVEDGLLGGRMFGDEWMREDVGETGSRERSLGQQQFEQRDSVVGQVARELGILGQDLVPGHGVVVVVERQLSAEQGIQDDTQAPNVHLFARVFLAFEHFRRCVAYRPTECLEMVRPPLVFSREAEINELDVFVLVEEDVLQLEIAVDA